MKTNGEPKHLFSALEEAAALQEPRAVRILFTTILLHCAVGKPDQLFETCWRTMADPGWLLRGDAYARLRILRYVGRALRRNRAEPPPELFGAINLDVPELDGLLPEESADAVDRPVATEVDGESEFNFFSQHSPESSISLPHSKIFRLPLFQPPTSA